MSTPVPSQEYQPAPAPPQKGSGLAIAALILGIFTLVICLIPVVNNLAYVTGLVAIVLGFLGRRGVRPGKGMALAGIITGVLGVIGAIVSTILYVSVLNGVSDALDEAAKPVSGASASSSSTDSPDDQTTPADDQTSDGPSTFKVGETASITQNGSEGATIKVTKVEVSKKSLGQYGSKPENGAFKVITVAAANSGDESFDVNPFDWYYLDADGAKYEYGDDNAFASGYEGKDFNGTTLNKGEKTSGTMVFDVPADAVKLVYAPNFDSEPIGIWTTK